MGQNPWNMQHAFPGRIVVLCDAHTASDGKALTEGLRRLGLGPAIDYLAARLDEDPGPGPPE